MVSGGAHSDRGPPAFSGTVATSPRRTGEALDAEATASRAVSCQPALSVDGFRIVAGLVVCAHYMQQPRFAESVAQEPVAWLDASVLLGLCIALGLAPRACAAAIVCMSVATYHWFGPETGVDGALTEALALWLVLLPCGQTLTIQGARRWRSWLDCPVSRWTPVGCCTFFALFDASLNGVDPTVSRAGVCWLLVGAGCLVAPIGSWRILGVVAGAIGLWRLASLVSTTIASGTSAAVICLLAGTIGVRRTASGGPHPPVALRAEGAMGVCVVILLAAQLVGDRLGTSIVERSTGAILETAGLPELVFVSASKSRAHAQ